MAHNNWRFHDHPLRGHWRHLPDDTSLVRGATIVIMPDGRRMRVPAMQRRFVKAPGDSHDVSEADKILKSLQAMVQGKKAPEPAPHRQAAGRFQPGAIIPHRRAFPGDPGFQPFQHHGRL